MFTSQILLEVSSRCTLTGLHSGCGQKKARELSDKISLLLLPERGVTADLWDRHPKQTEKYSKNDRKLLAAGTEKLTLFVPNTDVKTSSELQKFVEF